MARKVSNTKGYVYILTNPWYREDLVKIGRTTKEIDLRSKRLYNTAVPDRFQQYAAIKTSKYVEVEAHLHKILTDLANKRVNPHREFFEIMPQKAFEYMESCAKMIPDAELIFPKTTNDENVSGKNASGKFHKKGKYTVNTKEKFKFTRNTADATMIVKGKNRYVVLKGSRIDETIHSQAVAVKRLRSTHAKYLKNGITIEDIEFSSPSSAAVFVGGGACNGKRYWRSKDDKPLDAFITYDKNK